MGGGGGGVKKVSLESCVCEGGGGRWGERRDVGELCVCVGGGGSERREVLHVILFGGGGSKYFGKVGVFARVY